MNYPRILHTFMFYIIKHIYINSNDELKQQRVCLCMCVCVLNTIPNILHSLIPPKERKNTASLKGNIKNTEL